MGVSYIIAIPGTSEERLQLEMDCQISGGYIDQYIERFPFGFHALRPHHRSSDLQSPPSCESISGGKQCSANRSDEIFVFRAI